ncbi:MAG: amidohydrolase family protein [Candidatus Methanomethylophilaceae archaeon]
MVLISGRIWDTDRFVDGHIVVEDNIISEIEEDERSTYKNLIIPGIVDGHTHIADAGLVLEKKYGLEELVAPPHGLKHKYLNETSPETLLSTMRSYSDSLIASGVSGFIDFRENGADGCRLLRKASRNAVILGRPVSPEFDPNEIDEILTVADGIGISSISDMEDSYVEAVADLVHRRKKILALHTSERVREDLETVLSLRPSFIVHMTQATDDDMRKCADNDIPIVVCARSNLYFGFVPPLKRMYDSGARIAVGTDNAMISSADILDEFRTFREILIRQGGNASFALKSLLNEGRKLLYRDSVIGIRTGEKADLTVIPDLDDLPAPNGVKRVRYGPN